jgi:hypothetical protein
MPNNYVVRNDGNLVFERWIGVITHEELITHEQRQLQDTSIKPGAAVLADAREATFETEAPDVHELSDLYGRSDNPARMGRCALLVNDETYRRAQLFAKQSQQHAITIIIFNALDTACKWLGLDADQAREEIKHIPL